MGGSTRSGMRGPCVEARSRVGGAIPERGMKAMGLITNPMEKLLGMAGG